MRGDRSLVLNTHNEIEVAARLDHIFIDNIRVDHEMRPPNRRGSVSIPLNIDGRLKSLRIGSPRSVFIFHI